MKEREKCGGKCIKLYRMYIALIGLDLNIATDKKRTSQTTANQAQGIFIK